MVQLLKEEVSNIYQNVKCVYHEIQQNHLRIYLRNALLQVHNDICIRVFISAWFIIEKKWETS